MKSMARDAAGPMDLPDDPEEDFKPLTSEEARKFRERHPELSPWWVIGAQFIAGLLVAGIAWAWVGRPVAAVSAFYGAMAVVVPAALFARGTRSRPGLSSQAAMLRFFVWEAIKIGLTVAMLAAAPWLIPGIVWLALLAGVLVAMKMYWVALVVRPRLLNRI